MHFRNERNMVDVKEEEAKPQHNVEATATKTATTPKAPTTATLTPTPTSMKATQNEEERQQQQQKANKEKNSSNNNTGNNSKQEKTNNNNKNPKLNNKKANNNNNGNTNQHKKHTNNNNNNSNNINSRNLKQKNQVKSTQRAAAVGNKPNNVKQNNNKINNQNKNKINDNNKNDVNNQTEIVKASGNTAAVDNVAATSKTVEDEEKELSSNSAEILTASLNTSNTCAKCSKVAVSGTLVAYDGSPILSKCSSPTPNADNVTTYAIVEPLLFNQFNNFNAKQYRKSKSYASSSRHNSSASINGDSNYHQQHRSKDNDSKSNYKSRHQYYRRSYSDRRNSFDRNFAERNKDFVPIVQPAKPVLSSSNVAAVICDAEKFVIIERLGKGRLTYPIMQCGTLDAPDSSYHQQRSNRMDVYQIDDGFHSDGGTETPPPSPSSGSSIASTSDHGSLESVDTGGTQRLAVLSFDQVRKLHNVMDEKVAIHGRGNFPTLEVTLKDLVNLVRRKLESDVATGGAGVTVKDIRLNGGAASHVLASEDQSYNDLDLIYAIELTSSRHFDRVKTAVLNTLLDLLPEGVSKRRIMPSALKEAYVGKMVKVNNNNDGDRWSLISLGNSPGHKNVELKFVDTMRRQFEFSVDSFQIVLDSLLLFYDCATLPISENFYPTVVGESVYGDFQEALYHLQKKLISTRQPEEIRGGGLLKYCNLLVRQYKPVDPQRIKTLERYMCSRFFIDFPDINTQTVKLEAYLRNHFWGIEEEPLQYEYLMHLREVVGNSTVCLMGHERRQTLQLIESLATQVLYKEHQKQNPHLQEQQQYQHELQQHQQHQHQQQHQQQQPQTVTFVTTTAATHQHQQAQQVTQTATLQPQTIYVHQAAAPQQSGTTTTATICCALPATTATVIDTQQPQTTTAHHHHHHQTVGTTTATTATVPQTIQIQAGPPGLIYANGVYYAPVIPTTICTCNSTWLST